MIRLRKNDPLPLYLQIKESLRREVAFGHFRADEPIPDERRLAAELGLSRMTVRRALVELTKEGLFERIPGRGTFLKAGVSPGLAPASTEAAEEAATNGRPGAPVETKSRALTIAIAANFDHFEVRESIFYYRIIQAIHRTCDRGDAIVFRKVREPYADFAGSLNDDRSLGGAIVMGILNQALLKELASVRLPTVLVDSAQPKGAAPLDCVTHSGEESAFQAVSSLVALGHRDIGIMVHAAAPIEVAAPEGSPYRALMGSFALERLAGYERALRAHGIPVAEDGIHPILPHSTAAYALMRRILAGPRVPTAMFCTTDDMAVGAISAVKDHGWRVPEHMSVIGFGDLGLFATPPLSTVRMRIEEMGVLAVKLLRERLADPAMPARTVCLPTDWLPRSTCDLPRTEPPAAGPAM